ncbi:MAG: hypothetical protein GEV09_25845 [Pseudonocardiaceae bacterium]|nr:hypothetical protein [Pseudonocardiaceae bacterium]
MSHAIVRGMPEGQEGDEQQAAVPVSKMSSDPDYWTAAQCADYVHMTEKTWHSYSRRGNRGAGLEGYDPETGLKLWPPRCGRALARCRNGATEAGARASCARAR